MQTDQPKKRGGARPNSGRKPGGDTATVSFRVPKQLHEDLDAEAKRRKAAGERSLNAEFIPWAQKKIKRTN